MSMIFRLFQLKPKRAASDNLLPEHGCKQPRVSSWHMSLAIFYMWLWATFP